jgi:hypothetical protein
MKKKGCKVGGRRGREVCALQVSMLLLMRWWRCNSGEGRMRRRERGEDMGWVWRYMHEQEEVGEKGGIWRSWLASLHVQ